MGKWPDFEYHVGKWLKYDRSGFNSSHPSLGSPLNLGDPWQPLATCLKMVILAIFRHFQALKTTYSGTPYWTSKDGGFAWILEMWRCLFLQIRRHLSWSPKNTEWPIGGLARNMWAGLTPRGTLSQNWRLFLSIFGGKEIPLKNPAENIISMERGKLDHHLQYFGLVIKIF